MKVLSWLWLVAIVLTWSAPSGTAVAQESQKGADLFRQCAACHSLAPGEHLTGPSLAGIFGRKAGTAEGYGRYSSEMKGSAVQWNEQTLDQWLRSPVEYIPGTAMRVPGIADSSARKELIAYLRVVTSGQGASAPADETGSGMMGGGGVGRMPNLKQQSPAQQVKGLRYCGDAYYVTLGTGEEVTFWEFNLRLKTDSSANGPPRGMPAILRAGMRGDRASVIFSAPEEISEYIKLAC